ncbi:hypothetical protein [Halovenus salina]|uniref:hypothetical protein n=1 Tax=Halovenus salina TaxID=1510225 RepID=UPI002260AFB7|nr:hypothetical protein [Halovenus salina]
MPASLIDGRIIALGEATHGTREFFQLKHRFLRYLVERGAGVFALEANAPETLATNDSVVHGEGDHSTTSSQSHSLTSLSGRPTMTSHPRST